MNLRAYIDKLRTEGYTVRDDHGDDPMLIAPNGDAVETWREDYPYPHLMSRNSYEVEKLGVILVVLTVVTGRQPGGDP